MGKKISGSLHAEGFRVCVQGSLQKVRNVYDKWKPSETNASHPREKEKTKVHIHMLSLALRDPGKDTAPEAWLSGSCTATVSLVECYGDSTAERL